MINTREAVRGPIYLTFYLDDSEQILFENSQMLMELKRFVSQGKMS